MSKNIPKTIEGKVKVLQRQLLWVFSRLDTLLASHKNRCPLCKKKFRLINGKEDPEGNGLVCEDCYGGPTEETFTDGKALAEAIQAPINGKDEEDMDVIEHVCPNCHHTPSNHEIVRGAGGVPVCPNCYNRMDAVGEIPKVKRVCLDDNCTDPMCAVHHKEAAVDDEAERGESDEEGLCGNMHQGYMGRCPVDGLQERVEELKSKIFELETGTVKGLEHDLGEAKQELAVARKKVEYFGGKHDILRRHVAMQFGLWDRLKKEKWDDDKFIQELEACCERESMEKDKAITMVEKERDDARSRYYEFRESLQRAFGLRGKVGSGSDAAILKEVARLQSKLARLEVSEAQLRNTNESLARGAESHTQVAIDASWGKVEIERLQKEVEGLHHALERMKEQSVQSEQRALNAAGTARRLRDVIEKIREILPVPNNV